ncbi:MAG: ABC transporter permease [Chitinophagales bacterium]|nr:ABC transporter permease [Chitinophagales bacterium]
MGKIPIMVVREYWTRVRKKSFLITTLLAPVAFAIFIISSVFIAEYTSGEKHFAVIDESGEFNFKDKTLIAPADKSVYFDFPSEDYQTLKDSLKSMQYDGVIRIPKNFDPERPNKYQIQVLSEKRIGWQVRNSIDQAFVDQVSHLKLKYLNIDKSLIDKVNERFDLNYTIIGEAKEQEGFTTIASTLGMIMGFAIYISLFLYGTMVMKGVMEEKTNRIVEVIISSVKPFQLLLSKIIGIGAVGITQYFLWGVLIFIVQFILALVFGDAISSTAMFSESMSEQSIDPEESQAMITSLLQEFNLYKIGFFFIIYYLGGYLLYGSLFAAVGSATNDDGDLQSLTFPISIPIIISLFCLFAVIQDPDGNLAFWTSMIPFTSPIIMPARIAFDPPAYQIVLSLVFLVLGFIGTTWIAAKIYRTGILMYGKKITLKELGKWIIRRN